MIAVREPIPQRDARRLHLAAIAGNDKTGFLEVRHRLATGAMKQVFFRTHQLDAASDFIERAAQINDVYAGALPRARRSGRAKDSSAAHGLWCDLDQADALDRLQDFSPSPSIVIATGTPGHLLAIWQLSVPIASEHVRLANLRLALALGGDLAATDPARVLRVPGTLNHKHSPPRPVECIDLDPVAYTAREVVGHLADPPSKATPARRPTRRSTAAPDTDLDLLRSIPSAEFVAALTGRRVNSRGFVSCPFHADGNERTPSLHVDFEDGRWYCHACAEGGGLIEFYAALHDRAVPAGGREFVTFVREIADAMLTAVAA